MTTTTTTSTTLCEATRALRSVATDRILRLSAVDTARRALVRVEAPDPRSVAAVDIAERHAHGRATDEELAEARKAAWEVHKASCSLPGRETAAKSAASVAALSTLASAAEAAEATAEAVSLLAEETDRGEGIAQVRRLVDLIAQDAMA
jgi:hypothetical protein